MGQGPFRWSLFRPGRKAHWRLLTYPPCPIGHLWRECLQLQEENRPLPWAHRLLPAESRQSPADHRQLPEENLPLPPGADHQLQWEHRRWKLENHPLRLEYRQCPLTYFHPLRVQRHPLPERHPSPSPWCLPSLPASRQFREDCRRWRRR